MTSNPDFEVLKQFSDLTFQIRRFFHEQGFLEACTPSLVVCPGTEPYLDVFSTEFRFGKKNQKFYLPTSPEISLKKLLCHGSGPLFELKNVFRNNEIGHHHEPEFLMLEWYRPHHDLKQIQLDLIQLLHHLSGNPELSFQRKSMQELFAEYLNFELTPTTTQQELFALAEKNNLKVNSQDSLDDLFSLIFLDLIEAKLPKQIPIFVTEYPPFQAAYARLNEKGWADRFELYWQGLEIANAFHELKDAETQLQRMQADNEKKRQLGKEVVSIDEEFIALMKTGMPDCSGIALGVERLFMAIYGLDQIQKLKPFSPTRNF